MGLERAIALTGCVVLQSNLDYEFFYIIFFDLSKIYIIFFQNRHHAAGSFGGKEIPPDEPAVGAVGPRLTAYRRLNWR